MSRKLCRSGKKTNFHRKELFLKPAGTAVVGIIYLEKFSEIRAASREYNFMCRVLSLFA